MAKTTTLWALYLASCVLTAVAGQSTEHPSCAIWSNIARQLTTSTGAKQNCTRGTDTCTRIDCNGAYKFSSERSLMLPDANSVEVDYCFGIILNHCDRPLSLDFYMQVPEKNVNSMTRVFHNTLLPIPGLRYNISKVGSAEGFLYFEMKRSTITDDVTFSVTVKVRLTSRILGPIWLGALQRRLISEETVPVPSCPSRPQNFTTPRPKLGQCHPPHLEKGESPSTDKSQLSGNLDHWCNETSICDDPWLVCNKTSSKCICGPNFKRVKVEQGNFCAPRSQLGETCQPDVPDDCPGYMHVECQDGKCGCIKGFKAVPARHVCERIPDTPGTTSTSTPAATTPQATPALPHTHVKNQNSSSSKAAVIAGSVVGGIIVLAGILIVAYFAIRRLRRPYHNRELLLENDDSDGIM